MFVGRPRKELPCTAVGNANSIILENKLMFHDSKYVYDKRRRNPFLEYPKAILGQVCEKITNEDLYHSIVCGARGWREAIWSLSQWDKINKISGFSMEYDEAVRSN